MDVIMDVILGALRGEQQVTSQTTETFNVTVELATGAKVVGIIESTADGVVSIRRDLDPSNPGESYADIPRHFAISAVIGAYYTEGS